MEKELFEEFRYFMNLLNPINFSSYNIPKSLNILSQITINFE